MMVMAKVICNLFPLNEIIYYLRVCANEKLCVTIVAGSTTLGPFVFFF